MDHTRFYRKKPTKRDSVDAIYSRPVSTYRVCIEKQDW